MFTLLVVYGWSFHLAQVNYKVVVTRRLVKTTYTGMAKIKVCFETLVWLAQVRMKHCVTYT